MGEDDSIIQENTEEVGFHILTESRDQFGISFDDGSILLDGVIDSFKDPFFELDGVNDGRTIKGNSRHGIFLEDTDGVILDEVEVGNGDEHRILFGHIKQESDRDFLVLD